MSQPNLKSQVTAGILWSGTGRIVQQVIQFGLSVVMARLLSPGDYGLMAMIMVFTGFAEMLADAGFNSALVQKQDLSDLHTHTVYWVTLVSGGLLAAITFLAAPFLAAFYDAAPLKLIFQVISINFVLGALGNVPSALLQKSMRFKTLAKIETSSLFLSGIVGLGAAWYGAGVWSLVFQSISAALMTALFRCWNCRLIPKPVFSVAALKDIWGFSGNLYAFTFMNYWARSADNLIIGKFFGATALGSYSRAYGLMLLPISQIHSVISQVMFPTLSSIQNDKERVWRIYLRSVGISTLLAFPLMLGLFVVAEPFVITVYGEKWKEMAPLLQILALIGVMQSLVNSTGLLLLSQGATKVLFRWWSIFSILVVASFGVGILFGSVRALAWCYAAANIIYFYPALAVAAKVVDMKAREILRAAAGPFVCSLLMAIAVYFLQSQLPSLWPSWMKLAILVISGAAIYATLLHFLKLDAWQGCVNIILDRKKTKVSASYCE